MNSFQIAVLPGDGIGQEITRPCVELLRQAAAAKDIRLNFQFLEAGAELYRRTGQAFPEENFQAAATADAVYLAAMGLPDVRYPDGTEIGPQHDLRKRLRLYAGVRPCICMKGLPLPLRDTRAQNLDFVIVRESIEGIFAYPRKSQIDSEQEAYNIMKVSRDISEKLFDYSFRLAQKRKREGKQGKVTCIDKANVLSSMYFFHRVFEERRGMYPDIAGGHMYVDAAAMNLMRNPWVFDVCPTENLCGDILSDIAAALMGGMGMAPSGEIGDDNAVFQPCHGSAPDIAGQGKANPTGMILSGTMMLDYLADKFHEERLSEVSAEITAAVKNAYAGGDLLPWELGGTCGLNEIMRGVYTQLERGEGAADDKEQGQFFQDI